MTDSADPSGVGEHVITLAALLRNEVQVSPIFSDCAGGAAMACRGRTIGLDAWSLPAQALVEGGASLIKALERGQPDIVHIHAGMAVEGHALAAAARAARAPAVVPTEPLPYTLLGHPLVVLEAMSAGLPVVAARSLGITEAVRNEETGLLFPFANAPVLARTLAVLLDGPDLAACLRENGRAAIEEEFSAAWVARETLLLYRDVLKGKSLA